MIQILFWFLKKRLICNKPIKIKQNANTPPTPPQPTPPRNLYELVHTKSVWEFTWNVSDRVDGRDMCWAQTPSARLWWHKSSGSPIDVKQECKSQTNGEHWQNWLYFADVQQWKHFYFGSFSGGTVFRQVSFKMMTRASWLPVHALNISLWS